MTRNHIASKVDRTANRVLGSMQGYVIAQRRDLFGGELLEVSMTWGSLQLYEAVRSFPLQLSHLINAAGPQQGDLHRSEVLHQEKSG